MFLYLIFVMASGLAPNLHGHLIFRFVAGFFASTPLSCAGGTVADLWDPIEKTYAFPVYAIPAFSGPMVGQIMGSYVPATLGWRWLEWLMLIMGGAVLVIVLLFQPETYGNLILHWKASLLRKKTGDQRYRAPMEMKREGLGQRLKLSVIRPFAMFYSELIIILVSLYLTIIYIILFTFLEGYAFIFGETYGLSEGLTSLCWTGMLIGTLLVGLVVPVVLRWTAKEYKRGKSSSVMPEMRLWYTMLGGAPAVPISLFWMGWTSNVSYSSLSSFIHEKLMFTKFSQPSQFGLRLSPLLSSASVSRRFSSFHTCTSLIPTIHILRLHSGFSFLHDTWLREASLLLVGQSIALSASSIRSLSSGLSVLSWLLCPTCCTSMDRISESTASTPWISTQNDRVWDPVILTG